MDKQQPVKVDVWLWPLDVSSHEIQRLSALLTPEESERAARFFRPEGRTRWAVSRGRTRELLASVLGASPAEIVFDKEANGRPFIAGRKLAHLWRVSPRRRGKQVSYVCLPRGSPKAPRFQCLKRSSWRSDRGGRTGRRRAWRGRRWTDA